MKKRVGKHVILTAEEYEALCGVLGWVEAACEETEWHRGATRAEKRALDDAIMVTREAEDYEL